MPGSRRSSCIVHPGHGPPLGHAPQRGVSLMRVPHPSLVLKGLGAGLMLGSLVALLILIDSPLVAPGTLLAAIFRWQPFNPAYECMILGIYVVLGAQLWRAAADPPQHRSLIDFGIGMNVVHAVIMAGFALTVHAERVHLVGDIALLAIVIGALAWVRRTIA